MDQKKFIYCPLCAGKLGKGPKHSAPHCHACGFELYYDPRAVVVGILENDKGQILLIKRNQEPEKGLWCAPGGFADVNENAEAILRREIKEELGIERTKIKALRYLDSYVDRYWYQGINHYVLVLVFAGKIEKVKIRTNEEVSAVKFFDPDKMPLAKIAFAGYRKFLKKLCKNM